MSILQECHTNIQTPDEDEPPTQASPKAVLALIGEAPLLISGRDDEGKPRESSCGFWFPLRAKATFQRPKAKSVLEPFRWKHGVRHLTSASVLTSFSLVSPKPSPFSLKKGASPPESWDSSVSHRRSVAPADSGRASAAAAGSFLQWATWPRAFAKPKMRSWQVACITELACMAASN